MSMSNPVPELLAVSDDHNTALFSKKDQAVFIDISSQTVSGMTPLASFSASDKRWTAPDPRTIPTSAYTLAHTLCVESSTGVVAAGELGVKEMSYQVPKLVQASARRGGSWAQQQGIALTHDGDVMQAALATGGVVPQSLVHHMNDFFSSIDTSTEISPGFHSGSPLYPNRDRVEYESWGGDSGREWSSKIMAKAAATAGSSITLPAALTAASEQSTALSGRMTPEELIEDYEKSNGDLDTGPDSEDFRFLDTRPHDFLNSDDDVYGCKVCGQGAFTLLHIMAAAEPTWDVEDISDDLPEPDGSVEPAVLPTEDDNVDNDKESQAITASLSRTCYDSFHELESMSGTGENAHVVGDLDNDTSSVRYYFEPSDDRDGLVSLYVTDDEGKTWRVWSPLRMAWDPSGIPPHTILPIDRPSAYRAATVISSPTSREEYVHPSRINAAEWDVIDADLPDVVAEIDPMDTEREPEFFFDSINGSVFLGLVGGDDSLWMWDEDSLSWDVMPGRSLSPNAVSTNSVDASEYLRTVLDSDVLTAEALDRAQVITALDDDVDDDIVDDDDLDDDDDDLFSVVAAADDQDYTPEERSKNATQQVRDKMGRFARAQSTVRVGEYTGKITKIDAATQSVVVQFDNGKSATVPAKSVEVIKAAPPVAGGYQPLSEVPGSPDGPSTTTKARFAEPRTPLTSKELKSAIDGYEEFIRRSRTEKAQTLQVTPQNSDVKPLYMAVVDPIDRTAVIDLVALVPESEESSKPTAFIRTNKGWEPSEKIMRQLKSTTPPPVVVLNDNDYNAVLAQVDQFWTENPSKEEEAKKGPVSAAAGAGAGAGAALWDEYGMLIPLTAAGGLDRNRGGAEHLRRYWTKGPGALKIKWGLPGDWSRCIRHLSKYLGPRAKGYCFAGDTEFTTRDGVMTFAEAVGTTQFVLTDKNPTGKGTHPVSTSGYWVEAPILSFGEQRLLTVTLTRGRVTKTIRATPEHRWFVSPNGRDLRRFDLDVVTTEGLSPGMVLASIWSQKNEDLIPSPDGIRAGFIFGDGTHPRGGRAFQVDVWGDKQNDVMQYFAGYPTSPKKTAQGVLGERVRRIYSERDLKSIPDMRSDLDYLYGWLAGYIAADGSVASGSLVLYSTVREHVEAAQHIATLLGIRTGAVSSRVTKGYDDSEYPMYTVSFAAADVHPRMVLRKSHREMLESTRTRAAAARTRWRVVSVEDHGDVEEVFCAVVPETESFALTDGMWLPNCQLRHKEVLGMYTGTHAKMHRKGLSAAALLAEVDTRPTKGMADACDRALSWVSDGKAGSGFEKATAQRAKKIASRQQLTPAHIKRMHSFFSRHAVDKKAKGWNPGDASYPSPGRVAWDAWGGDAGQQWAAKKVAQFSELSAVQFENLAAEGVVELFTVPTRLLHHDAAVVAAASRTTEVTIATRTPYLVEAAALDEFSADRDLIPGEEFLVKDGNSLLHAEVLDTRDFLGWEGSEALLFLSEDDTIMLDREPEGS